MGESVVTVGHVRSGDSVLKFTRTRLTTKAGKKHLKESRKCFREGQVCT